MKKISYAEIGVLIGVVIGLVILGAGYLFSKTSLENFCPLKFLGEENVASGMCVRWISVYPFIFAILGLIIGLIIDRIREGGETNIEIDIRQKEF